MRVLITGATGYLGSWTTRALQGRGHATRLLVRDADKARAMGAALGFDTSDLVVGDMCDGELVRAALDGCDAAIHAAAVVDVRTGITRETSVNLQAAHAVVGQAVELGLDPVVYVSSLAALWRPDVEVFRPGDPVGRPVDAYGASKIEVEEYVRGLQDGGAPITTTYPGGIAGPAANGHLGEGGDGFEAAVRFGSIPGRGTTFNVVDVRDLAELHVRLLEPGRGPRRVIAAGHCVAPDELGRLLEPAAGRRLRHVPVPDRALIALGRVADRFRRFMPATLESVSEGSMIYLTQMPPGDNTEMEQEYGVTLRPLPDTFAPLCEEIARRIALG